MPRKNQHATREGWLTAAMQHLESTLLVEHEHLLPQVRVSCGFPYRMQGKAIGQCWSSQNSEDETFELFVSPVLVDPVTVLATLLHEMIHAAVGTECGHKGEFRKLALAVGFRGKMTATVVEEGTLLHDTLSELAEKLGPYPHGALRPAAHASKPNGWARFESQNDPTYRVVANLRKVEENGAPFDPWGAVMVPCRKAG